MSPRGGLCAAALLGSWLQACFVAAPPPIAFRAEYPTSKSGWLREHLFTTAEPAQLRKAIRDGAIDLGVTEIKDGFLVGVGGDAVQVRFVPVVGGTRVVLIRPMTDPDGVGAMRAERVKRVVRRMGAKAG